MCEHIYKKIKHPHVSESKCVELARGWNSSPAINRSTRRGNAEYLTKLTTSRQDTNNTISLIQSINRIFFFFFSTALTRHDCFRCVRRAQKISDAKKARRGIAPSGRLFTRGISLKRRGWPPPITVTSIQQTLRLSLRNYLGGE